MSANKIRTFLLIGLLMPPCAAVSQQAKTPSGAWIPTHLKWTRAPAYASHTTLFTASTRVLYFQPDGKLLLIGCLIYRTPHHLAISVGDGHVVSYGDWHRQQNKIVLHYRLMYQDVQRIGETLPGPWQQTVLTIKNGHLFMKGESYEPSPQLDQDAASWMPHFPHKNH